jgi:hypothetical protein
VSSARKLAGSPFGLSPELYASIAAEQTGQRQSNCDPVTEKELDKFVTELERADWPASFPSFPRERRSNW